MRIHRTPNRKENRVCSRAVDREDHQVGNSFVRDSESSGLHCWLLMMLYENVTLAFGYIFMPALPNICEIFEKIT